MLEQNTMLQATQVNFPTKPTVSNEAKVKKAVLKLLLLTGLCLGIYQELLDVS